MSRWNISEDESAGVEMLDMTVLDVRDADEALRGYAASKGSNVIKPLGLSGDYQVEPWVMDSACDYWLDDLTVTLTPEMTAWDVLRAVASKWRTHEVMNTFVFASLSLCERPGYLSVVLFSDVSELQDEQLDAMPFHD